MKDFSGRVAFITGAASGIGLGIARAFTDANIKVMLADIDQSALDLAVEELSAKGADVDSVICDVTKRDAIQIAADKTIERFGKVHIVINNAGVLIVGGVGAVSDKDWQWNMNINFMSVVYGVEIFTPLIEVHGEGGNIVNTSSVGGHIGYANLGPYNASKFAVTGYSESIHKELKDKDIYVSALCPGFVNTQISNPRRADPNLSEEEKADQTGDKNLADITKKGMSPDVVGRFTLRQMQKDALYIFSNPGTREEIDQRYSVLSAAYDETDADDEVNADPGSIRQEGVDEGDVCNI